MQTKMNLERLLQTHHVVTDSRILWDVLKNNATDNNVYVRNLFFDEIFPIDEVADGPFIFTSTPQGGEISGTDKRTTQTAFLRIIQSVSEEGVVELKNILNSEWFRPAMGGIRIYIPF